jgi:hypothetical protein
MTSYQEFKEEKKKANAISNEKNTEAKNDLTRRDADVVKKATGKRVASTRNMKGIKRFESDILQHENPIAPPAEVKPAPQEQEHTDEEHNNIPLKINFTDAFDSV